MKRALTVSTHALGVVAFVYPFFLPARATAEQTAHSADAPILFTIFGALLVALALTEIRSGAMDAKHIALLGVLAGINAVLRLPGALGGASLMFVLPILCGYAFGARFGFLLGAMSMAASGVITGGVGPWLPFQMWALGWVGAGAGLLPKRYPHITLTAYGWVAGFVFGALVNLWFWPFQSGTGPLAWNAGLGPLQALSHYWRFYAATSLLWDAGRALANAILIATIGRPVLRLLLRYRERTSVAWRDIPFEERILVP